MSGLITLADAACFVTEADRASSLQLTGCAVVAVDTLLQVVHLRLEFGLAVAFMGECAALLVDHARAILAIQ